MSRVGSIWSLGRLLISFRKQSFQQKARMLRRIEIRLRRCSLRWLPNQQQEFQTDQHHQRLLPRFVEFAWRDGNGSPEFEVKRLCCFIFSKRYLHRKIASPLFTTFSPRLGRFNLPNLHQSIWLVVRLWRMRRLPMMNRQRGRRWLTWNPVICSQLAHRSPRKLAPILPTLKSRKRVTCVLESKR